jgi:hypothetical protein
MRSAIIGSPRVAHWSAWGRRAAPAIASTGRMAPATASTTASRAPLARFVPMESSRRSRASPGFIARREPLCHWCVRPILSLSLTEALALHAPPGTFRRPVHLRVPLGVPWGSIWSRRSLKCARCVLAGQFCPLGTVTPQTCAPGMHVLSRCRRWSTVKAYRPFSSLCIVFSQLLSLTFFLCLCLCLYTSICLCVRVSLNARGLSNFSCCIPLRLLIPHPHPHPLLSLASRSSLFTSLYLPPSLSVSPLSLIQATTAPSDHTPPRAR